MFTEYKIWESELHKIDDDIKSDNGHYANCARRSEISVGSGSEKDMLNNTDESTSWDDSDGAISSTSAYLGTLHGSERDRRPKTPQSIQDQWHQKFTVKLELGGDEKSQGAMSRTWGLTLTTRQRCFFLEKILFENLDLDK